MSERTNPADGAGETVEERAAIVKENLPFVDDETARLAAADELHPGKINPASRDVDDARSAGAGDANKK